MNNKRLLSLLLILIFSFVFGQKISIKNNTLKNIYLFSEGEKQTLKVNSEKTISIPIEMVITDNEKVIIRFLNFLNPDEKLKIILNENNTVSFFGDKQEIYTYIYGEFRKDCWTKMDSNLTKNKNKKINFPQLKINSEMFLSEVLKKVKLKTLTILNTDTKGTKLLKKTIKYHWIDAIFIYIIPEKNPDVIQYYYEKYLKNDLDHFSCTHYNGFYQYSIIHKIKKIKKQLKTNLPMYKIVAHTKDDDLNIFLPPTCQRETIKSSYRYNKHIHNEVYKTYKEILIHKFNYNEELLEKE